MSDIELQTAQRTAAVLAFHHIGEICETEREHVLIALIDALPEREAQLAEEMLYHLREARAKQLQLVGIFEAQRNPIKG